MNPIRSVLLMGLFSIILTPQAHAFCFLPGSDLCSVSCRGKIEKITPELVRSTAPTERVCALALAADDQTLNALIKAGVDINTRTTIAYRNAPAGRNALFRVVDGKRMDLFKALIANHIDVNVQDRHGDSPLMMAAWDGRDEMVEELLQAGALPNLKDDFGKTALWFAQSDIFSSNQAIVDMLKKAGGVCE
jgi:ankyrin repeat protein